MVRSAFLPLLLLVCAPLAAQTISGAIYDDPPALAVRTQFVPLSGVRVALYRDGQAGALATTSTDAQGRYAFSGVADGDYFVVVDSKSIGNGKAWAEQTFGPAGAQCAQTDGSTRTNRYAGSCVGGRSARSDDAGSPATAEHVARVRSGAMNVDFAFSFNIVTSTDDASGAPIQGSLRQFVENANAIPGPNAMRFVPLARPTAHENPGLGMEPRWWTIALKAPLPALRDAGTTIDGTAHNILSTASVIDVNQGRIGEPAYVTAGRRDDTPRQEKPELELVATGDDGIVCEAACAVRALALHGAPDGIVTRGDATIEQTIIGALPNVEDAPARGRVGLQVEKGTATVRFLYVAQQETAGVAVAASGARIDADRIEVMHCGTPQAGAAIALLSDGSALRHARVFANDGAGIVIGSPAGNQAANGNVVEDSVVSNNLAGIVLAPGSSRNALARNQITWNRIGGIVAAPYAGNPPQENRISANIYDENGGRPIALNAEEKADMLAAAKGSCDRIDTVANHGIAAPDITAVRTSGDAAIISGHACPGQTVEVYQSYVTSAIRNATKEASRLIRKTKKGETITIEQQQEPAYPSIGEFNFVATTTAGPDGTFEVTVPIARVRRGTRVATSDDPIVTNEEVLRGDDSERAYSALAIDAQGNTSEMSERKRVSM
jgi:Right handed beta helix region/SdrD B-like domain